MSWPSQNGSDLEASICNETMPDDISRSVTKNVVRGSNDVVEILQNSDGCGKPKKAVVHTAHTINLSCGVNAAARVYSFSYFIRSKVIGKRFGLLKEPLTRLIPLSRRRRRCIWANMVAIQAQCDGSVLLLNKFEWLHMTLYEQDEKQTDEKLVFAMGKD